MICWLRVTKSALWKSEAQPYSANRFEFTENEHMFYLWTHSNMKLFQGDKDRSSKEQEKNAELAKTLFTIFVGMLSYTMYIQKI